MKTGEEVKPNQEVKKYPLKSVEQEMWELIAKQKSLRAENSK